MIRRTHLLQLCKEAVTAFVCLILLCAGSSPVLAWQSYSKPTWAKPRRPIDWSFSDSQRFAPRSDVLNNGPTSYFESSSIAQDPVIAESPETRPRQPVTDPQINNNSSNLTSQNGRAQSDAQLRSLPDWLNDVTVGYDEGFQIASRKPIDLQSNDSPFRLRLNGWGQLRHTRFESANMVPDGNQFQLKRARIVFSGHAFTQDFNYFFQLDGRSSSGDDVRLLDYLLTYDLGRHLLGWRKGRLGFRTGKWKMPFTMARYLSGREFEFSDRSVSSTFFDVNRSLAWGLYGAADSFLYLRRFDWEVALFNGLVTGGAETGSSGTLDDNFAYSGRLFWYPTGDWGEGELADFDYHCNLATRAGIAYANSTIARLGRTEFDSVRVVDSGARLSSLLPLSTREYTVNLLAMNGSLKYRGWSISMEYYFRIVDDFKGIQQQDLFDHGHWLQIGKFIVPRRFQLLARWSRVVGNSGTLGVMDQSSDERSGGFAWYFREQNAKFVLDATYLDGAPINSAALDINPGDTGWLYRTQIQFAF